MPVQRIRFRTTAEHFTHYLCTDPNPGACWLFVGHIGPDGYGKILRSKRTYQAHRVAWELASGGPVPDGLWVLHTCDVRACVRNDDIGIYELNGVEHPRRGHLWLGTIRDNVADMMAKGRQARGDATGVRLHPETRPRGDLHHARTRPEVLARGDRHGARTHPEQLTRGASHHSAKMTEDQVREIRRRAAAGESINRLAREYGLTWKNLKRISIGESWKHVT